MDKHVMNCKHARLVVIVVGLLMVAVVVLAGFLREIGDSSLPTEAVLHAPESQRSLVSRDTEDDETTQTVRVGVDKMRARGALKEEAPSNHFADFEGRLDVATTVVVGRVLNNRGAPVPGASVTLSTTTLSRTIETSAEGLYEQRLLWEFGTRIPTLTVVSRGYRPRQVQIDWDKLTQRPDRLVRDVRLSPGAAIVGRVVGGGRPAVAARVNVLEANGQVRPMSWADGSGQFFVDAKSGDDLRLVFTHGQAGFAERLVRVDRDEVYRLGTIHLARTSCLSIRTVYSDGQPAALLPVRVASVNRSILTPARGSSSWSGTTNEGGEASFYGLAPDDYKVTFPGVAAHDSQLDPTVVRAGPDSLCTTEIVVPFHRVRVYFRGRDGETVPPDAVKVRWSRVGTEGRTWQPAEGYLRGDALFAHGTEWKVRAGGPWGVGSRTVFATLGTNETRLDVPLVAAIEHDSNP